jgi:hypothetical protein
MKMLKLISTIGTAALLAALPALPAMAGELAKPTGKVVLTISGQIDNTNGDGVAEFDMAMLEALAQGETKTKTPWYDGEKTFTGPTAKALVEAVGGKGTTMTVLALNDYATEIPLADFTDLPVILATKLDGEAMSLRDKGPIFVIYPFDQQPELNNETYYGRSAWQVKSIEFK